MPQPFIKDKIYIPKGMIDESNLKKNYETVLFDDNICSKCEYLEERPCTACKGGCQGFTSKLKLWGEKSIKGVDYYYVPSGNIPMAEKTLGIDLSDIKDKRKVIKLSNPIKFTGSLRDGKTVDGVPQADQVSLVRDWLKKKYGVVNAPPRTGKTVIGIYCACSLGVKTLIVAKQTEFLQNFMKTLHGLTNVLEIEKQVGHKIVGIVNKLSDFENLDVACVTYQKFISIKGQAKVDDYINGKFSFVIVDEVHGANAIAFSKFVNSLVMRYRMGLSATPLRKDGRHVVGNAVFGPVVAKSYAVGLVPLVEILETKVKKEYKGMSQANWVYAMKFLYNSKERNKLIVKRVFKDLREGHKVVIIPTDHIKHMHTLVDLLNKKAKKWAKKGLTIKGEIPDFRNFAVAFHASCNRQQIIDDIDTGRYKVIVTIRSMMKEGIDVKSPSSMILTTPMSANPAPVGSPFFYQLANRVCTPMKGKMTPKIWVLVDNMGISCGCLRSLMTGELLPGLRKPKDGSNPKYKMQGSTFRRIWDIVNNSKNYKPLDYDDYKTQYNVYDDNAESKVKVLKESNRVRKF